MSVVIVRFVCCKGQEQSIGVKNSQEGSRRFKKVQAGSKKFQRFQGVSEGTKKGLEGSRRF